ncbi:MAG: hypothetical protein JW795_06115 [Chitinivibrionales bacterium]|nr:hypothetical protein [Chitinivibrionales bacterium]
MLSKIVAVVGIIGIIGAIHAQNARINAMGDVSVFSDFSTSIYSPTNILNFPDQVQGTIFDKPAGSTTPRLGPFIVSKTITDRFSLGLTGNLVNVTGTNSSVLNSDFYRVGTAFLSTTNLLGNQFSNSPHILAAFSLSDMLNLGIDGYWESRRRVFETKASGTTPKTTQLYRISNIGAKVAADISLGELFIGPSVNLSIPSIYYKSSVGDSTTAEAKSKDKLAGSIECYAELPFGSYTLAGDIAYTNETYRFQRGTTTTRKYANHFINMFAGTYTTLWDNVLFAAQYDLRLKLIDQTTPPDTSVTLTDDHSADHVVHCGFEAPMEGFWIFDTLTPRCGAQYSLTSHTTYTKKDKTILTENDLPIENGDFGLAAGFGLTKGIFTLDVSVNLSDWSGIVVGPSAARVTATFDFGRLNRSGNNTQNQEKKDEKLSFQP